MKTIAMWYFDWGWMVFNLLGVFVGISAARTKKKNGIRNLIIAIVIYLIFVLPLLFFI